MRAHGKASVVSVGSVVASGGASIVDPIVGAPMRRTAIAARAAVVVAVAALAACAEATPSLQDGLEVVPAEVYDVSPRLSDLAKNAVTSSITAAYGERARIANPPRAIRPLDAPRAPIGLDPTVQPRAGSGTIPSTAANFEGMGTGLSDYVVQSAPPDPAGDVGPSHYVQAVNFSLAVFSRSGDVLLGPIPTRALWSDFAGACAQTNDGDATVRYDHLAQRWVIAQFSVNGGQGPFYQCLAVSTSSDPLGSYNRYQFGYAAFNDYPKMALWPNAYYFTFNMFAKSEFVGGKICAMDRARMLAGSPATMHCYQTGPLEGGLLASDLDGKNAPPKGAPAVIVTFGTDELMVWRMHADFAAPSKTYLTEPVKLPVTPFRMMCDGRNCVRQPDTGQTLDAVSDRLMNRMPYRRFATHDSVVLSHSVVANTSGGVRWYELRGVTTDKPVLHQQGTFAPDSAFRFMSSIAMDQVGNIALGYAVSASNVSPGIRYTGRLTSDPLGTFGQGEGVIVEGFGAQIGGLSRFGDYSALNVDPVDDCTFWYTQEYIGATGSFNWRTRVASFKFPSCGSAIDDFSLVASPEAKISFLPGQTSDLTIDTRVLSGSPQNLSFSIDGLPAGVTATFVPSTVMAGQSAALRFTATAGAAPTTAQVEVTGTGSTTRTIGIALTVRAPSTLAPAAAASEASAPSASAPCASGRFSSSGGAVPIPDNSARGIGSSIDVPHAGRVAKLRLSAEVAHSYRGDLVVALVSPGGVRHVLADRQGKDGDGFAVRQLELPAFSGADLRGRWTLEVSDRAWNDRGELVGWSLDVAADCAERLVLASAAPRPLIDHGQSCSTLRLAGGDAAKVAVVLRGVHDYRSSLRASLRFGGRVTELVPAAALARGAGAFSVRARPTGLLGSAAGDWTLCVDDLDGHADTGELSWHLETVP